MLAAHQRHSEEERNASAPYAANHECQSSSESTRTNRPKVERSVKKALALGALASLEDLPGRGNEAPIAPDARARIVALACQKAKDLGYSYERWTMGLLASHVRNHCQGAGHPSLIKITRGTVSTIP